MASSTRGWAPATLSDASIREGAAGIDWALLAVATREDARAMAFILRFVAGVSS